MIARRPVWAGRRGAAGYYLFRKLHIRHAVHTKLPQPVMLFRPADSIVKIIVPDQRIRTENVTVAVMPEYLLLVRRVFGALKADFPL